MTNIEKFVISQNVSNYQMLLEKEEHPEKRTILLQLLNSELAKLPEAARRVALKKAAEF